MAKATPDLPAMEGPGVGQVKDRVLERLGGELDDLRDKKATLAEKITQTEKNAVERMKEKGLSRYRYGDREMILKPGNDHITCKEVKGNGAVVDDEAESD